MDEVARSGILVVGFARTGSGRGGGGKVSLEGEGCIAREGVSERERESRNTLAEIPIKYQDVMEKYT